MEENLIGPKFGPQVLHECRFPPLGNYIIFRIVILFVGVATSFIGFNARKCKGFSET